MRDLLIRWITEADESELCVVFDFLKAILHK